MRLKAKPYPPSERSNGGVTLRSHYGAPVGSIRLSDLAPELCKERERMAQLIAQAFNTADDGLKARTSTTGFGLATRILRPANSGRAGYWFIIFDTGCELWVPDAMIDALDFDVTHGEE